MSRKKLDAILALAELYRRELTEAGVRMYVAALSELTDQQVEQATALASASGKFMPAPCELIEIAKTGGTSYEAQALIAFEELREALYANDPRLMSPLTAAVAKGLGSFRGLQDTPLTEFTTWKRKDFLAAYATITKENPQRLAAIAGPRSELSQGLLKSANIDTKQIEDKNRKALEDLRNQ